MSELVEKLTQVGFEHYEISNFARPGYRSRHNSSYWHEIPYIGLGAAAHSYRRLQKENGTWDITRSWNIDNLQTYIHEIQSGNLPSEKENSRPLHSLQRHDHDSPENKRWNKYSKNEK